MSFGSRFQGLVAITVMAAGQVISMVGSGMTTFALMIWMWQTTGQAMNITLLAAFSFGPLFLLTPLAGALVDRWDRKIVMMVSDLGAGLASVVILGLLVFGRLEILHLFLLMALAGAFRAFQMPACAAAVTTMVGKKDYARVNSILSLPQPASLIVAPILAGALITPIGIRGILVLDIATFVLAVASLAVVRIPRPPASDAGREAASGLGSEMLFGWRYLGRHRPLLGLALLLCGFNFALMLAISLLPPMVLARTGGDELVLGLVQSLIGSGSVAGAVALGFWGGPRRQIDGVIAGVVTMSALNCVVTGLSRAPWGWYVAGFLGALMMPVIAACSQAIWQAKIPPDVQGRVFAMRRILSQGSSLPAFLIAGPLADHLFEPALEPGGSWAATLGPLVGTGPGAGMALIFVLAGGLGLLIGLVALATPKLRRLEELVPDHAFTGEAPADEASGAAAPILSQPPAA